MKSIAIVLMSMLVAKTCHQKNQNTEENPDAVKVVSKDTAVTTPKMESAAEVASGKPVGNDTPKVTGSLKDQVKTTSTQDNTNVVTYEAFSRGMFLKVLFSNNQVLVFKDRNNTEKGAKVSLSASQMSELNTLLKGINPKTIETLKAPTDKRLYDGAAHATFTMTVNGVSYATPGFDHGAPPAAIQKFVDKLISYTQEK